MSQNESFPKDWPFEYIYFDSECPKCGEHQKIVKAFDKDRVMKCRCDSCGESWNMSEALYEAAFGAREQSGEGRTVIVEGPRLKNDD